MVRRGAGVPAVPVCNQPLSHLAIGTLSAAKIRLLQQVQLLGDASSAIRVAQYHDYGAHVAADTQRQQTSTATAARYASIYVGSIPTETNIRFLYQRAVCCK